MIPRSDVLVVGAGLIGTSTALHLRWRGLTVRVLERDRLGDGTSARGGGWVAAQSRPAGPHLALALASIAYFPELLDRIGDDCGYLRCGSLVVLESDEQLALRRAFVEQQRANPSYDGVEFLDARALHDLEPAISDRAHSATYRAADGQIDPPRLLRGLVTAGKRAGVSFHFGAGVTAVDRRGSGWVAQTPVGAFAADVLVNAAGVWSPRLAEMVGTTLPVSPVAGQMMMTAPRERFVNTAIGVFTQGRRDSDSVVRDIRQGWDGRVWLGTTIHPDSWSADVSEVDTKGIRAGLEPLFPGIAGAVIEEAWAGVRPNPVDRLPILGAQEGVPGYYVGVPMAGICESAATGKALAELISAGTTGVPIAGLSPDRFALGGGVAERRLEAVHAVGNREGGNQ